MANLNAQIVAQIKVKLAAARTQVAALEAALVAFGAQSAAPAKRGPKAANGATGGGARAGYKPVAAIQAAQDARAVKNGTATPEQVARYNERQAQKALKASAKAATTVEDTVSGGDLAAAAAS